MVHDPDSSSSSSTGSCEPVLFVTTAGADPSQELAAFAEAEIGRERLHEVAMGQGQAEVALQLLRECAETGKRPARVLGWKHPKHFVSSSMSNKTRLRALQHS
jgi:hypothetical protein